MKLADDFLEVCLNYDNEIQKVLKELNENDALNFLGRNAEHIILKNRMFVVEEEDFNKAILLCKQYNRSIQKQAYELKFKQFKETGEWRSDYGTLGRTYNFISDLRSELNGRRRNYDKQMLINASLRELFPEAKLVSSAIFLIDFCARTKKYEVAYEKALQSLQQQQTIINKIHDLQEEGKTITEIVEVVEKMGED